MLPATGSLWHNPRPIPSSMTLPRVRTRESAPATDAPALHVVTFGCQMNKYDSLLVEGRFRAQGYRMSETMEGADVILFNTCSVREHAEERVYSWVGELRSAKERRPDLVLGVMGCMAQRAEDEIFGRAAHVDIVCGTRQIQHLPTLVDEVLTRRRASGSSAPLAAGEELGPLSVESTPAGRPGMQARRQVLATSMDARVQVERGSEPYTGGLCGYLTVMRGCDLNCTFCIVPKVRGRVQSAPIEELVREARWMVAGGARVITLLGQTVDSYGEDLPKPGPGEPRLRGRQGRPSLADLLYALQEVEGLERIRLITLHPSYVTPALAQAIRDCDKVDRFLPLPAQSGSDEVLRRMKRGYTTDLYRRRVETLRAAVPDIELGSDWIVGFPGESEDDFEATLAFQEELGFVQNYVFKYDPRPETRAFDMVDDVAESVKKERNQRLLRAGERVALGRHERWIGREVDVFVEEQHAKRPELLKARTRHNLPVSFEGSPDVLGSSVRVRLEHASPFGLSATRATASE